MQINTLELKGDKLDSLNIDELKRSKATLIKGACIEKEIEFVFFASKFGNILPYNSGPIFSFDGIALDEVEIHFDGISQKNPHKVPKWIIFHVIKSSPTDTGGKFKVCDSESVLNNLDSELKNFLRKRKLRFYGYDNKNPEKFSFEIDPIKIYEGRETLRIFLPSLDRRFKKDSKKVFANTSIEYTNEIFDRLRKEIYSNENIQTFHFEDNDILILDNRFTFHGREKFKTPVERIMNRIQTLGELSDDYKFDLSSYIKI